MMPSTLQLSTPARLPSLALVTALTFGGALSGFASAALVDLSHGWGGLFVPGLLFGIVLATYLWLGENIQSVGVASAIVVQSIAALLVAVGSPVIIGPASDVMHILWLDVGFDRSPEAWRTLGTAGLIGATGVSLGFLVSLRPRAPAWRITLEVACCAAAGALLAARGPQLGDSLSDGRADAQTFTIVIWQSGMASILGVLSMFRGTLDRPVAQGGGPDRSIDAHHPGS